MTYGHFSSDGREYIITDPNLPRPWINYLYNSEYCAVISHTGGGYSFFKDCRTTRLTTWNPENLYTDRPGRYIFLRDNDSGRYWSLNWQPICPEKQDFQCRHGQGYTVIKSRVAKIRGKITYLVPRDEPCELWQVSIKNEDTKERNISVFSYVNQILGDFQLELLFKNIFALYNEADFDTELEAIIAQKHTWGWERAFPYIGFFGSSAPVRGYDCRKEAFWGRYERANRPEVLVKGRCTNSKAYGENMVSSLEHNFKLKPEEEISFTIIMGLAKEKREAARLLKKYRDPNEVKKALKKINHFWQSLMEKVVIETPDPDFDRMVNIWSKYQLYTANTWSRSPSYYHEGTGGRGYRDSCQDAEGILSLDAAYTKNKLRTLATMHFKDGHCASGWSDDYGPFTDSPRADHPVWFTYTLVSYVKETGDIDFLREKIRWLDGGEGTIFEHTLANLSYLWKNRGRHKVPLIGIADWNDAIDMAGRKGKGESVWLGIAFHRSLLYAAQLAHLLNKKEVEEELLDKASQMKEILNSSLGWDKGWYLAGYNDEGEKFGASECREGRIHLNPQTWSILARVSEGEREKKVLAAIDKYCDTRHGPVLLHPAYTTLDLSLGRITKFARGIKENAAIFCHAVAFKIVADCMAGRGDKAYQSYSKIHPMKQPNYEVYKAEPYVFAEYLVGPDHPYLFGEGAFTWITGTAAWMYLAATEWILGARREFEGLRVDPCLPRSWHRCRIKRTFRGDVYDILIKNPEGVEKGVRKLMVDGKKIKGSVIRPFGDGRVHNVEAIMG